MNNALGVSIVVSAIIYGTPLLIAGLGELLAERSGILNLGVEGMMLVGAVTAFFVSQEIPNPAWLALLVAVLAAAVAGGLMSLIHAFLTITLGASQIVSGLALTIFGGALGLSSYLGSVWNLGGVAGLHQFRAINLFGLKNLPIIGPIVFHDDAVVYGSWILVAIAAYYLHRTRMGLHLRAVGESPETADAMGINVTAYRYTHTVIGGLLAGVAGAYFTLAISPSWLAGLTEGDGWIAIALVIVAFWRPDLLVLGAYLFGGFSSLGFDLEARGVSLPPEFFAMIPYVMTIIALIAASGSWAKQRVGGPAAIGIFYSREEG